MDLAAIKARAEAATPVPWVPKFVQDGDEDILTVIGEPSPPGGLWWIDHDGWIDGDDSGLFASQADAAFIANARTDVPALVAEVDRLRGDLRIANEASLVLLATTAELTLKVEDLEEELRTVHAPSDFEEFEGNLRPTDEAIAEQAAMTEAYYADPDV